MKVHVYSDTVSYVAAVCAGCSGIFEMDGKVFTNKGSGGRIDGRWRRRRRRGRHASVGQGVVRMVSLSVLLNE